MFTKASKAYVCQVSKSKNPKECSNRVESGDGVNLSNLREDKERPITHEHNLQNQLRTVQAAGLLLKSLTLLREC